METPGWTTNPQMYAMGSDDSVWTAVEEAGIDGTGSHGHPFALNSTLMSSAAFQVRETPLFFEFYFTKTGSGRTHERLHTKETLTISALTADQGADRTPA
jgi:hypothetical protein